MRSCACSPATQLPALHAVNRGVAAAAAACHAPARLLSCFQLPAAARGGLDGSSLAQQLLRFIVEGHAGCFGVRQLGVVCWWGRQGGGVLFCFQQGGSCCQAPESVQGHDNSAQGSSTYKRVTVSANGTHGPAKSLLECTRLLTVVGRRHAAGHPLGCCSSWVDDPGRQQRLPAQPVARLLLGSHARVPTAAPPRLGASWLWLSHDAAQLTACGQGREARKQVQGPWRDAA